MACHHPGSASVDRSECVQDSVLAVRGGGKGRIGRILRICRFSRAEVCSRGAEMGSFARFPQLFAASVALFARFRCFGADAVASFAPFFPQLPHTIVCHFGRWVRFVTFAGHGRVLRTQLPTRDVTLVRAWIGGGMHAQRQEENSSPQRSRDKCIHGTKTGSIHQCFHDRWRPWHSAVIRRKKCRLGPDRPMKYRQPNCQEFL